MIIDKFLSVRDHSLEIERPPLFKIEKIINSEISLFNDEIEDSLKLKEE